MDYISSRELSEKWGIGQCRIILLAREGRIPGAKLFGRTWMFPDDAVKPADERTKAARQSKAYSENGHGGTSVAEIDMKDYFRFPIFEYKDAGTFAPTLSEEELSAKAFVECFNSCQFEKAGRLSDSLPIKSHNRYHRIHALYCCCMIDIFLCNTRRFMDCYRNLQAELAANFPHKDEMREFLFEIDATLGEETYYTQDFNAKPAYSYHESFLPRLCNLSGFCLILSKTDISPVALQACEANCRFLEKTDNYFDLQALHVYLGCAYAIAGRTIERDYHYEKAIMLAMKHDMFYVLATQHYYMRKEFNPALKKFPAELKKKLNNFGYNIRSRLKLFSDAMQLKNIYASLTSNDYIYVVYAMHGLTNKEIAAITNMTVGAVGKKYSDIYALLGVKNKAGLIESMKSQGRNS